MKVAMEPTNGDLLERIDRYVEELFAPLDRVFSVTAGRQAISLAFRVKRRRETPTESTVGGCGFPVR